MDLEIFRDLEMDLELLGTQGRTVPRRRPGWMLLVYLLALAMNRMTWTVNGKLSGSHSDRRLMMLYSSDPDSKC